ncbi:MAG TPA: hypothetical protein VN207_02435 [Ktedonobacteraceae bacterium]|nr:hypothetical protein [Ktedonobacteraceae bacterium]
MRKITFSAWIFPVLVLFLLAGEIYSSEHAIISHAVGSTGQSNTVAYMKQVCDRLQPRYNPPPQVDSPDSSHAGDLPYAKGHVIDGIANIYMIYWSDPSTQPFSPKFVSLTEQFIKDFGQSPLYANLSQYRDTLGQCPTGARLAGTFVDHRPFSANVLAERKDPNVTGDQLTHDLDTQARQEIAGVAAKQGWNTQDYHNVYGMLLPIADAKLGACVGSAYHNVILMGTNSQQYGSPFMFLPYPCGVLGYLPPNQDTNPRYAPNRDPYADGMVWLISHELVETVSDPDFNGWTGNGGEIADKCDGVSYHVNPRTHGNVTWNRHHYGVEKSFDNLRHGCVLEGP